MEIINNLNKLEEYLIKESNIEIIDLQKVQTFLNEIRNEALAINGVRRSATESANLISSLNNTLLANKQVGTYKSLETKCLEKLSILINEIEEQQA